MVPKRGNDIMGCETARLLKLTTSDGVHPLKYTEEGHVFVDRDSHYFEMLINYLRSYRRVWPQFRTPIE